jgi:hypothetical protein
MVEATVDDVIDMISVRHGFMAAVRPVHVAAVLAGRDALLAALRIGLADRNDVLVVMHQTIDLVRMMQVTVVQIVDVVVMAHRLMTAAGAVTMVVIGMGMAVLAHR